MSVVMKSKTKKAADGSRIVEQLLESAVADPVLFPHHRVSLANPAKVGYYLETDLVFINASCSCLILRNLLHWSNRSCIAVVQNNGRVSGIVNRDCLDLHIAELANKIVDDVAVPWNKVATVSINDPIDKALQKLTRKTSVLVVLNNNRPVGTLRRDSIAFLLDEKKSRPAKIPLDRQDGFSSIIECFPDGLVVLDRLQNIVFHNKSVLQILPKFSRNIIGKQFELVFGGLFAENHKKYLETCPINEVIKASSPVYDQEVRTTTGRTYVVNYHLVIQRKSVRYVVVNFRDITHFKIEESKARRAYDELTRAFGLMLPSVKIEKRLKAIPEYRDYFDHNTGLVEIVEVIKDGAYRHVINCLKIASELYEKGLFDLPELDRNIVVQALITHDVGKQQPILQPGDIIDPAARFPEGAIHAEESAKLIAKYPLVSRDVVTLVRFHHHEEKDLPSDFPSRLLPMYRLVRLIDGLSAGVTRKNALLSLMVEGSKVTIYERNCHPLYNGIQEIHLLSGNRHFEMLE